MYLLSAIMTNPLNCLSFHLSFSGSDETLDGIKKNAKYLLQIGIWNIEIVARGYLGHGVILVFRLEYVYQILLIGGNSYSFVRFIRIGKPLSLIQLMV